MSKSSEIALLGSVIVILLILVAFFFRGLHEEEKQWQLFVEINECKVARASATPSLIFDTHSQVNGEAVYIVSSTRNRTLWICANDRIYWR